MTQEDLQHRLHELARAAPQNVSGVVVERLRIAFGARLKQERQFHKQPAKLAALALIAVSLYLIWMNVAHRQGSAHHTGATAQERQMPDFIALPYAQSDVPLEQPVIVRVQIPVSELGAIGVRFASMSGGERINADLLVGQDGVARAVRLVQ